MSEESSNGKITYEALYNISLKNFYEVATEILEDFHFSIHRNIADIPNRRRIEVWRSSKDENDHAMLWIEVIKPDEKIDPYIGTDVLRSMNDENVVKLFFFTNGDMSHAEKDVLDSGDHYIFGPTEIVETLQALDKKRSTRFVRKRKAVKAPSGFIMIKNHMKAHMPKNNLFMIKTSSIPELVHKYLKHFKQLLSDVDRIEDINNIPPELKERFKYKQNELLPEMNKISSLGVIEHFNFVKDQLLTSIQYLIIYIGALIEFESEDEMKKARNIVEENVRELVKIDELVNDYTKKQVRRSEFMALKIIAISVFVIAFFIIFFYKMG